MKISKTLQFIFVLIYFFTVSCKKDQDLANQDNILGTWVSIDKSHTLTFMDNSNLWRHSDHYDYEIINDSIRIGYSGKLYIYVLPTNHRYNLNGNNLSIDFSNRSCYGFDLR
jgi:hypothetical protein